MAKYEATINSYKKKLDDFGDLKRQVKTLEESNTDYIQRNIELEEDAKKTGNCKPRGLLFVCALNLYFNIFAV